MNLINNLLTTTVREQHPRPHNNSDAVVEMVGFEQATIPDAVWNLACAAH